MLPNKTKIKKEGPSTWTITFFNAKSNRNNKEAGCFCKFILQIQYRSLLNQSGISKTKGASPLAVFTIIFNLAFTGKNFFQGVVKNKTVSIGKDAVYNLKAPTYNWRRFTLMLSNKNLHSDQQPLRRRLGGSPYF
ncbi:MAG: hypothetical protein R2861_12245 [Desulfobacterales bacterium]